MPPTIGTLDERFAERVSQIEGYERTWWLQSVEPQRSFLAAHPERRAGLVARLAANQPTSTVDVYRIDYCDWFPERVAIQRAILDELTTGPAETPTSSGGPPVYFLLGLPGSGKSTTLRSIATAHVVEATHRSPLTSDADELRARFPEYQNGFGSGVVQAENAILTYGAPHLNYDGLQPRVLAVNSAVLVDVIGDPEHLPAALRTLRRQGRGCYALLADCPLDVCIERVKRRAVDHGRYVPLEVVRAKAGVPRRALDAALAQDLLDGWAIVDTQAGTPSVLDGDGVFQVSTRH